MPYGGLGSAFPLAQGTCHRYTHAHEHAALRDYRKRFSLLGETISPRLASASTGPAATEEQPIERDTLLQRERDQEIRMGGGAVLVPVHVLLKNTQLASERTLRPVPPNLTQPERYLALMTIE